MQQLKFIPFFPVQFVYNNGNDTLPNVVVLELLHEEDNPGFLGVNLNYMTPTIRAQFLTQYQRERFINRKYGLGPYKLSTGLITLANGCLRRYNYDHITEFISRGNPRGWCQSLTNKFMENAI